MWTILSELWNKCDDDDDDDDVDDDDIMKEVATHWLRMICLLVRIN